MSALLVNNSLRKRFSRRCFCGHTCSGKVREFVHFTFAKLVFETLQEWEDAAQEFTQIAARVDYEDEFAAFDHYELARQSADLTPVLGASRCRGLSQYFLLEFLPNTYLCRPRSQTALAVEIDMVRRMITCQGVWERACIRMRNFADCGDLYRLTGAADLYADLCQRGLQRLETWPTDTLAPHRLPL